MVCFGTTSGSFIREIEKSDISQEHFQKAIKKFVCLLEAQLANELSEKEVELLINEIKKDFSYADAALEKEREIIAANFYQELSAIFGEENADEMWSAVNWDEKLVTEVLINLFKKLPEISQNIEQAGIDLEKIGEEMSDILSQNQIKSTPSNEHLTEFLETNETEYLLSTEANRQHLEEAIEMLKNPHNYIYIDLNKLWEKSLFCLVVLKNSTNGQ